MDHKGCQCLASRVGKPLVMDAVTASMCKMGVGRVRFARVMVESKSRKSFVEVIEKDVVKLDNKLIDIPTEIDSNDKSEPATIPLWIKICSVPLEAWTTKGVSVWLVEHSSLHCPKNKVEVRIDSSKQGNEGMMDRDADGMQNNKNDRVDKEGFIQKGNVKGRGETQYAFQPNKKVNNDNMAKETMGKQEAMNSQGTQGSPKQTPANKAWNIHGDILSAMKRSTNKYSMFELYNESEIDDLKYELIDKEKNGMEGHSTRSKKVDDVLEDNTGPSTSNKQKVARDFIANESLSWDWYSNMQKCDKGCKIMIGWDSEQVNCNLVHCAKQSMLCEIMTVKGNTKIYCTFIYAANGAKERRDLWKDLQIYKSIACNQAWIMLGDMNVTLNPNEHSDGSSSITSEMNEFKDCINSIEMEDVVSTGYSIHGRRIFSRLRWVTPLVFLRS
nr:RNA-directed DNA polymerase, eukaryota, reverse transcriptase zinc-binding domain protein [Tanacetum cinerariifolium]